MGPLPTQRLLASVLVFAALLSGCLGSSDGAGEGEPEPDAQAAAPFAPVAAVTGCGNCWEPAVAVDTQGRIFAVTGFDTILGVSSDGGATYTQLSTPPTPPGAPDFGVPGDAIVDASPSGRIFYLAFFGTPALVLVPMPLGLHVASSADGGVTWDVNAYLSITTDPTVTAVTPWKNWLAFGPGGETYVAYALRPGGVWVARSDDDGAAFTPFVQATPPPDSETNAFIGQPAVLDDGRLLIPHWGNQLPGFPPPFAVTSHSLRVAISDDLGATFRSVVVFETPPTENAGQGFPIMALDDDGSLYLAHQDMDGRIQVRSSTDRGESWSEPVDWADESGSAFGVWIQAQGGLLRLMYVEQEDGDLVWARGAVGAGAAPAPTERGVVAASVGTTGDFPHFDLTPDGRMAAVWSDLEENVFVGVGAA